MPAYFVIHGTYKGKKVVGVVADLCGHCGGLRAHEVVDHTETNHVYFIPIWTKTVATTLRCPDCKKEEPFEGERFGRIWTKDAQKNASEEDDFVGETNPRLRLAMEFAETHARPEHGDPLAQEASEVLFLAYPLQEAEPFLADVREWAAWGEAQRQEWLSGLRELRERIIRRNRALAFADQMAKEMPTDLQSAAAFFLAMGILGGSFYLAFVLDKLWLILVGAVVGAAAAAGVYLWMDKARIRAWLKNRVLPTAAAEGVDVADLVTTLGSIPEKNLKPKQARLQKKLPMLVEVARESERGA